MGKNIKKVIDQHECQKLIKNFINTEEFSAWVKNSIYDGKPECISAMIYGMTLASMLVYRCDVMYIEEEKVEEENVEEPDIEFIFENGIITGLATKLTTPTNLVIPSEINGEKVICIGNAAFHGCTNLIAVTIPDTVTIISHGAFGQCTRLTTINIPEGVKTIGKGAFAGCISLKEIRIPDSVIIIGDWAFAACLSLTSIRIPQGMKKISRYTFSACNGLQNVFIPGSIVEIDENAFFQCKDFTIYYSESFKKWSKIKIHPNNDDLQNRLEIRGA